MSWTEEKVAKLKELWGKGNTASQIAEIIGGISRNAVIGKAHRLNLSAKLKTKISSSSHHAIKKSAMNDGEIQKRGRRSKFRSLIIEKDFEPENPKQLEELDENTCKWPVGHPNESSFYFCGRSPLKNFSYCKLHLLYAFQQKSDKKDEKTQKSDEDVPSFLQKKIKSA
tara:strand:- start:136 stop:642 length:507 start_codon:yes stop_codon:yes gene_type:complete